MDNSDVAHTKEGAFLTMDSFISTAMKDPSLDKERLYAQELGTAFDGAIHFQQSTLAVFILLCHLSQRNRGVCRYGQDSQADQRDPPVYRC